MKPGARRSDAAEDGNPVSPTTLDEQKVKESILNMQLSDLNFTTEEIDFSEVDDDLIKFQEDDVVQEALNKGVDLRNYSRQLEGELVQAQDECVDAYIEDVEGLAALHGEIQSCDMILERMQNMYDLVVVFVVVAVVVVVVWLRGVE